MFQGRVLCHISLLISIIIALSAYSPRDFLGVYDKAKCAELMRDDAIISATGQVYHKEIKGDKVLYYVKDAIVYQDGNTLSNTSFIFKYNSDDIPTNCKLNIEGQISQFLKATNEGAFDMKDYYNSLGLCFEVENVSIKTISVNFFERLDLFYRIRIAMSHIFEEKMGTDYAGVLSSIVIGEKSNLSADEKDIFQKAGVAHILAVSGLHVSLICMALYRFIRKRGVGFVTSGVIASVVAVFYGLLTGASISSVRAIGMFLIYLLAEMVGESYDMLTAMSVMAILLLVDNPLYIKNGSFIFSFGAVLGIFYIAIPLNAIYLSWWTNYDKKKKSHKYFFEKTTASKKIIMALGSSFVFSFGIFVGMLPIVTQMYYQTPLYSIFINLLVLPLMPILLGCGLCGGVLGVVGLDFLSSGLLLICKYIISFYELLSTFSIKIPFGTIIVGHHSIAWVITYYLCLAMAVGTIKLSKKRMVMSLAVIFLTVGMWMLPQKGGFEMDFIDVGQGDGIYINSGDGVTFFIDGGSTSENALGQYTLGPFLKYKGKRSIDYWFLSHMDLDHVSGLLELLKEGYDVKNIVLSNEIPDGETLSQLLYLAEENGTEIIYMKQNDVIATKHLSFKCLYPYIGASSDDINALSLALLMEYDENVDGVVDFKGFFGGDLGVEQESYIASSNLIGRVDLLKVSHHGSKYSSDEKFLRKLSPKIAIISCGLHNRYGHPADEAVERIKTYSGEIFYTMYSGRIRVDRKGIDVFVN